MLELAVKAGLPLIQARTPDTLYFEPLMAHLVGRSPERIKHGNFVADNVRKAATSDKLFWTDDQIQAGMVCSELHRGLTGLECTLIALNQDHTHPEAFNAGMVPIPPAFVRGKLLDLDLEPEQVDAVMPALHGLALKPSIDLVKLCQARHGVLSGEGVLSLRQEAFSSLRGVQVVDTALPYYFDDGALREYLAWAGRYLLGDQDLRLRPRGLLLSGPPGTGKTMAAKHVARTIGIPLLRLDLGSVKGKYVGESEAALRDALRQVEREAPCVLLLDEVEKLFGSTHDEGTTQNLLASVLWFLAEHRERILTVMTTNDEARIPPELTRQGRLDVQVEMPGLDDKQAEAFAYGLAGTFLDVTDHVSDRLVAAFPESLFHGEPPARISHAFLAEIIKEVVRDVLDG